MAQSTARPMLSAYRVYLDSELGKDGYPWAWHERLKHDVREDAGHRCVRCGHPYRRGEHGSGEWTPCDEQCSHGGPVRYRHGYSEAWRESDTMDPGRQLHYDRTHVTTNPADPQDALPPIEIEAHWRILTVHHLDGVKANCRWWNLVALCQRCHLQIQGKVQMARVWAWEHSEWFRPYVAGYYASVYLGQELTRAEVDARLDELLGLERMA